jgi:hypothetical protein
LGAAQVFTGIAVLLQIWQSSTLKELVVALVDDLNAIKGQLTNARSEIVGKIADLESALAYAGTQTAEVNDAVAALKDVAKSLDDIVPDTAPPTVVAADPAAAPVKAGELPADTTVVEVPAGNGPADVPSDGVPVDAGAIHPESWVTPVVPAPVDEAPVEAPVEEAPAENVAPTEDTPPSE